MGTGLGRLGSGVGAAMQGGADAYTRLMEQRKQEELMQQQMLMQEAQKQMGMLDKQVDYRRQGENYGPEQVPSLLAHLYPQLGETTRKFPLQGEFQGQGTLEMTPTETDKGTPKFINVLPKREKTLTQRAEEERTLTTAREQGKYDAIPPEERQAKTDKLGYDKRMRELNESIKQYDLLIRQNKVNEANTVAKKSNLNSSLLSLARTIVDRKAQSKVGFADRLTGYKAPMAGTDVIKTYLSLESDMTLLNKDPASLTPEEKDYLIKKYPELQGKF